MEELTYSPQNESRDRYLMKGGAVGLQKGAREGNLSLYVAREPPSTSLATVLALKDRSFTCGSFASRTRSLATPFTHSLESDSITAYFLEDRSFFTLLLLPAGSAATDGAYYHIETSEA